MNSFTQLFLTNLRVVYRNTTGLFWTIAVPVMMYIALALLPVPTLTGNLPYKDFALPGVVAYVIMQGGIYTLAYWMVDLKSRGVIKRFLVTPLKYFELIVSLIAARLTVILIQILFITLIGVVIFKAPFAGNIISTIVLGLLGGGIFLCIGLLIANYANSYEAAAPITTAIGMPFAFLGNLFLPLEVLPHGLQIVARILPITYLSDGLRKVYLFPFDFAAISTDILILFIWLVVLLVLTASVFRFKE